MTRTTTCLLLIAALLRSSGAHAQGFILPELGARLNAMGAAVGRPDDLSAIYHNPAALASLPGTQVGLSFGATFLGTDVRVRPWCNDQTVACTSPDSNKYITDPVDGGGYYPRQTPQVFAPIPFVGASTKLWSQKVTGALGVYIPNAAGASFGKDAATRYHIIDAYVFSAFFTAAAAYRPWPWLAVGAGVSAVYVRVSRHSLLYPVFVDARGVHDYSILLGSRTEIDLQGDDVRPAFSFGIQAWPHRTVSLGFMMLSRYDVALQGPLTLTPGPDSSTAIQACEPDGGLCRNQQTTTIVAPWVFGFGANWDITPWLEVGGEFRYHLTSQVDRQVTTITQGKALMAVLPEVSPASGSAPAQHGLVTPKNLHDYIHTGGGFRVHPLRRIDLDLFSGVHYENSASPNNTVEVSAPSFDLAAFHLGARWGINDRFRVALSYSHYWYFQRTTTDSITFPPTNFVGSATAHLLTLVLELRLSRGIGTR